MNAKTLIVYNVTLPYIPKRNDKTSPHYACFHDVHGHAYFHFLTVILGYDKGKICTHFCFPYFLNDLEEYFIENNIDSLEKILSICQESLLVYIKLFLILYADDTVLMSKCPEGLQKTLTAFENYCINWKLKVNTSKSCCFQ